MAKEKKTILIVEDDVHLLKILKENFILENLRVLTAKNGKQGLKSALKEHPDIILLDILMPVMDGIEMIKKLNQDKWGAKAEIIILTNLSVDEKRVKKAGKEVGKIIIKTEYRISTLVEEVKKRLRKQGK